MKLVSVTEMRALETAANQAGYSYAQMMETAGRGIAEKVMELCINRDKTVLGLVGGGNNGGDTLIALTALQRAGWKTSAILLKAREESDLLCTRYLENGGVVIELSGAEEMRTGAGVVLDGAFGTGFRPPLTEESIALLESVRLTLLDYLWIAVDCPSGIDCDNGEVSPGTVKADLTICLEAVKRGMLTSSGFPFLGRLEVVDLGISGYGGKGEGTNDFVVDAGLIRGFLPCRDDFSHKGSYGTVFVMGGCVNYPGAPVLAGEGAYAVGAGLVKIGIPSSIYQRALSASLELTWVVLDDDDGVISEIAAETAKPFMQSATSLVVGPGIGREDTTRRFLERVISAGEVAHKGQTGFPGVVKSTTSSGPDANLPPMVIDADGLVLLSTLDDWANKLPRGTVLTPHPGEMAVLAGLPVEEIQKDRMEIARDHAKLWGQVVVLKGALTVVAAPDGRTATIPVATSCLAKAGTGDVLAGMIGGLLAQGLGSWEAAVTGAWLHANAGLYASTTVGCCEAVRARDVIAALPHVYQSIKHKQPPL